MSKRSNLIFRFFILIFISCIFVIGCTTTKKGTKSSGSDNSISQEAKQVIKEARSFTGTPYKFGGTSRAGMDCSGLLLISYQKVGKKVPRTSEEQYKLGKPLKENQILPGDWLFFSKKKGSKKIAHVGLVTEVKASKNIQFIHSTTKLGVVEDNLYAPYYYEIFLGARRPF